MNNTCQYFEKGDTLPCIDYIRPDNPSEPGFCRREDMFRCIEAIKRKLPAISQSSLSDFIHCKRRYYHRIIQGLQVRPHHLPEPMKLGRAWDLFVRHVHEPAFDHLPEIRSLQLTPEQQAKLSALMRAYQDLEITHINDELLGCQYQIFLNIGEVNLTGYVDRAYSSSIRETKLSSRPEFYTERENLTHQLGTYFMGNERWQSATMEITRLPGLMTGKGKNAEEDPEAFEKRIYGDILSRPAFYFIGWDRLTRTYGVRFYRSEFDLDELFKTYRWALQEIQETAERGSWYQNHLACHVPGACQYLPIKRTGVVSEEIYEKRRMPTDPAPLSIGRDDWCKVCTLTKFMSASCKVKNPCPRWTQKGGDVF